MKTFSTWIVTAVAVALGAPTGASAQQPVPNTPPPVTSVQPAQPLGATPTGNVYGWVDSYGRVIPYQTYSAPYQPSYYSTPCSTVYYYQPTCYYPSSYCYQRTYYYPSCYSSRHSYGFRR